jgi:glycine/D-amino acid oxidase-like deaminating enzyme
VHRRHFLKTGGSAGLGLALGACSNTGMWVPPANLYPVRVSWDRIIRTTVGLRPYRESGFVVRSERLANKTVIHNYGHGGSGMSLCWGTAHLAADLAVAQPERRAAVIGSGIIGLSTARVLQRRGFQVAIYAKVLPPDTTSNKLFGDFTPNSSLVRNRTPQWDEQFRRAVEISYREHNLLVGRGYGVGWIDGYSQTDNPDGGGGIGGRGGRNDIREEPLMPRSFSTDRDLLGPGQHPFQTRYARRAPHLHFDPDIYLDALMRDVLTFGGSISVRGFDSPRDFMALDEPLIVNCTGLGAKQLFDDQEMTPIKGQLTVLLPQPEVDYTAAAMTPRASGIVLGHVLQRGESSLEVDQEAQIGVVENAMETFNNMRPPDRRIPWRSEFRAPRVLPPVESFFDLDS